MLIRLTVYHCLYLFVILVVSHVGFVGARGCGSDCSNTWSVLIFYVALQNVLVVVNFDQNEC